MPYRIKAKTIARPCKRANSLNPSRDSKFDFTFGKLLMLIRFKILEIEVPPTRGIAGIGQIFAIGGKLRLKNRYLITSN